jgi:hypothetical protein
MRCSSKARGSRTSPRAGYRDHVDLWRPILEAPGDRPGDRLEGELALPDDSEFARQPSAAQRGIPAHLGERSVPIEVAHREGVHVVRFEEDDAICADSGPALTAFQGYSRMLR